MALEKHSYEHSFECLLGISPFEDGLLSRQNDAERLHDWLALLTQPSLTRHSAQWPESGSYSQVIMTISPYGPSGL